MMIVQKVEFFAMKNSRVITVFHHPQAPKTVL